MASTAVKMLTVLRPKGSYLSTILGTAPIALWPLSETSGTSAVDVVGGLNGTYAGPPTLNSTTFPDGTAAPLFDSTGEVVQLSATDLNSVFNTGAGTISAWLRVRAGSVWTDSTVRVPFSLGVNANNRVFLSKSSTNNRFELYYVAGGTYDAAINAAWSTAAWFHAVFTWNTVADQAIGYLNGAAQGSPSTTLGTWAGSLGTTFTAIGNISSAGGANFWDGYIKYAALWNRALTPAEVASLAPAAFQV